MDKYLNEILNEIKKDRNVDFFGYRDKLLVRRIMTRVRITRQEDFKGYFLYLKKNHEEMDYLMDVMTINVTEFFRDPSVFDAIEKKVIPDLFENKKKMKSNTLRVWSCACASGEEPYSMLILLSEFLGTKLADFKISILGTDIDGRALGKAKEGVYEASQFSRLSDKRKSLINKYFYNMKNNRYWIREEWPDFMRFKYHDVIADIPFEYTDMILCRNVFIYFDHELQEQILKRFWISLRKGGFLILGKVESIFGKIKDNFIEYDRENRIYIKK